MNITRLSPRFILLTLVTPIMLILSMMNAYASTATVPSPKPPLGSLKGNALTLAIPYILDGIGWVMEEGTKVNKTTPTDGTSGTGTGTTTGTDTGTRPINQYGDYPHEFLFDGQSFGSASSAHEYIITTYITQKGFIRTRRESDGLEYDKLDVYYGTTGYFSGGIGYFRSCVLISNASSPPTYMIGGWVECFSGRIMYKGRLSESNTELTQDYRDRRDQAKTALEQAIAEAAQHNEQAVNEAIEALNGMKADTRYDSAAIDAIIAQLTGVNAKPISTPTTGTGTQTGATTGTTEGTNTDTNTDTNTQDTTKPQTKPDSLPFEMPGFCKWASHVCDFINWFKEPPELPNDDYKPKVTDLSHLGQQNINPNYYNATASCPNPIPIKLSFGTFNISYQSYCDFAIRISPLVVAMAYVLGAYIVLRGR